MNLKNRIATNMSLLFMLFFGGMLVSIYALFSKFRNDEFRGILDDRISTVANFVEKIKNNDETVDLNLINNTPSYSLQQEQILVFNPDFKLIYSNIKDRVVEWNHADLETLKRSRETYRRTADAEIFGKKIDGIYYLIQARDVLGISKIGYLRNIMAGSFLIASAMMWILSFLFSRRMLAPLNVFQKKITNISVNNLNEKLPESSRKDEINLLAKVFNTMLDRINRSYSAQKEFTASASHEIKTPLARMAYQLENLSRQSTDSGAASKYIAGIRKEVFQLSDTVDSLLILSKIEDSQPEDFEDVRLDEVIFTAFEKVKRLYADFEMNFSIVEQCEEGTLAVKGIRPLLEIVFINLFKNAELYSDDHQAAVYIFEQPDEMRIEVASKGEVIPEAERTKIFEAFRRGSNSRQKSGSGLGLRISKRIMDYHTARFSYHTDAGMNVFVMHFP